jgi:Mg2+-importing ATPase
MPNDHKTGKNSFSLKNEKDIFYYAKKEKNEIISDLETSIDGISNDEAKKRIALYGRNVLLDHKKTNIFWQFLSHFSSPLILILLLAAIISFLLKEISEAVIIIVMVLLGVLLDFGQEYSADKALKELIAKVSNTTTVIRNGEKREVEISELTYGDILFLSSGDMVPADARVISAEDFFVNQSSITGESYPSEKNEYIVSGKYDSLTDLGNIVFMGSNVVSGSANAVIVRIGTKTEYGKIADKLADAPTESNYENGIKNFGFFLAKIIFFLVTVIFFINAFLKQDLLQSFMFAVAIAVGVTPELLPMIMSVTMTVGSKKMSKKGVIVKRLSSIPNFGSMNILCTDKTGTLTENQISIVKYVNFSGFDDESVLYLAYLNSSFQTSIKNPIDDAVVRHKIFDVEKIKKIDEIPYDFYRKRMSIVVEIDNERKFITKGAPEEIYHCVSQYRDGSILKPFTEDIKKRSFDFYQELSRDGFRVLTVATKTLNDKKTVYDKSEEKEMVFEGFIAFLDPPKKDVREVIKELNELGVSIKIITGDNELVAKKICHDVGIEEARILLGRDMDKLSDDALKIRAEHVNIFARCSPDEKSRIIKALKSNNNTVGYLGDGINDVPSLKSADVSITVDCAVDIAKESADIVLTQKSLLDLKDGIIEGRKTFGNTMKYIMMALSSNFGNMFSAAGASLFLPFLPMLPIQILLNNFIYDFSQVTIPSDQVDKEWILKPKKWDNHFVKKFMYVFGPISSIFDFTTFFLLFYVFKSSPAVFQTGWFMESLATQTLVVHIIRTKRMPFIKSCASLPLILSTFLLVAVGWIIPYTPLGIFFKFAPLPWHIVLILIGIVVFYLMSVEIVKRMFYKRVEF